MAQSSLELRTHLWRLKDQPAFGAAAAVPGDVISLMFPGPLSRGKDIEFNILFLCLTMSSHQKTI